MLTRALRHIRSCACHDYYFRVLMRKRCAARLMPLFFRHYCARRVIDCLRAVYAMLMLYMPYARC